MTGIRKWVWYFLCLFAIPQPLFSQWSLLTPWKHQKTKGFLMFLRGSKKNLGKKRIKTVKGLHSLPGTSQTGIRNIGVYVLIQKGAKNREVDWVFECQRWAFRKFCELLFWKKIFRINISFDVIVFPQKNFT